MNRRDIHRRAHAVIDALTDLEPGQDQAQGPGWRKKVRNRLRTQHWPALTTALGDNHDQAVTALVAMLAGRTTTDVTSMQAARADEFERNRRRLDGRPPACELCDDTGVYVDDHGFGWTCSHQGGPEPSHDPAPEPVYPSTDPAFSDPSNLPVEAPQ